MKIFEILFENDVSSSSDSGPADSGTSTDSSSDSAEATPSTDSSTTSSNIATVIYPFGSMIRRPYFNYVRPAKKCKHGIKKDGKCKKKEA